MTRFLIFYIFAYGGAHAYFFIKLSRACRLSRCGRSISGLMLLLFFLSPLVARKLEAAGFDVLPEILTGAGYLWMGLLFLFVTAAAVLDIFNLIIFKSSKRISPATLFTLSALYMTVIGIYGYYEARNIVTDYQTIRTERIPLKVGRIRIVQVSDLHIGQIVRERRVESVISAIKNVSPDIVVSTGDLVDGHQKHFAGLERLFLELQPKFGKYAILGNHEYYVGKEQSVEFIRNAGFNLLINNSVDVGSIIRITGIDDSRNNKARTVNAKSERALLESTPDRLFRLLLKHRPVVEKTSEGKFDLQLSGHTHKGQIFPFNILTWLNFPVRSGLTELQSGSLLYLSRGTGVWGPPIRFLAPPELTVIDLVPEQPNHL